ncbi:MAG: phage major capsid protein, partial [Gammaproteobacteria bacterium]
MSGDALEIKKIEEALGKIGDQVDTAVKSLNDQVKAEGEARQELKGAVEELMKKYNETADQLHDLMQKGADRFDAEQVESFGEMFSKSEQYKQLGEGRANTARLNIKTAIINATGQNQPLVSADRRAGIIANPDRILTVRDLLPVGRTSSNLIEFAKENVFTNNAGPQVGGSPEAFENVTKPESAITFTLATAAVTTLAHFIPASKQVLSDSGMLNSYVDNRLLYGLKLKEETQLLLGAGANGELDGIYTQATALTQTSPNTTNEIDIIRMAIKQAHQSEYRPTAVLLNPADWFDIDTRKVGASD